MAMAALKPEALGEPPSEGERVALDLIPRRHGRVPSHGDVKDAVTLTELRSPDGRPFSSVWVGLMQPQQSCKGKREAGEAENA